MVMDLNQSILPGTTYSICPQCKKTRVIGLHWSVIEDPCLCVDVNFTETTVPAFPYSWPEPDYPDQKAAEKTVELLKKIANKSNERRPWECPRCRKMKAPHVDECGCEPKE